MALSETFKLEFKFGGNAEFLTRLESLMQRVDARFESVSEDIKDASDATENMSDSVKELNKSFNSGLGTMSSFGDKLKEIAKYYISISAAKTGLEKVWSFGRESMNLYSTQERAENQLRGVMRNRGTLDQYQRIKDYAADIQGRSIYGDEAMIKGAGELATYVQGTESLKSMMTLLTDYAAGMTGGGEVSPEQMESLATGLGMAYDGNYMAMRRKGFDTTKLEALDALQENGGVWGAKERKKYGDVLTKDLIDEAKKAGGVTEQMRVDALKESMSDWAGLSDEVNKLDSSAIIRFNNKLGDLREELGKRLFPVFNKLVQALDDNLPNIESMFSGIGDIFESLVETFNENMGTIISVGESLMKILPVLADIGLGLITIIESTVGFREALVALAGAMLLSKLRCLELGDSLHNFSKIMRRAKREAIVASGSFNKAAVGFRMLGTALKSTAASMGLVTAAMWGLQKIGELVYASISLWNARAEAKARAKEIYDANNPVYSLRLSKIRYNKGEISEEQYKSSYDAAVRMLGDGAAERLTAAGLNIWESPAQKDVTEKVQKDGNKILFNQFNTNNITQDVKLTSDPDKIGVLLNQRVADIIEMQLRRNREISIANGV
ncbi:MAG: hypothetical protein HUK20_06125 [Fibrobacter sp.]|nr:hypothetical protein [Fibrobacter sp.]